MQKKLKKANKLTIKKPSITTRFFYAHSLRLKGGFLLFLLTFYMRLGITIHIGVFMERTYIQELEFNKKSTISGCVEKLRDTRYMVFIVLKDISLSGWPPDFCLIA